MILVVVVVVVLVVVVLVVSDHRKEQSRGLLRWSDSMDNGWTDVVWE